MAINYSELDDLCGRLQLPNSTTSAAKRLMSVLYSLSVVEVNASYYASSWLFSVLINVFR